MKVWIVDKDTGKPLARVTEGDKQGLIAAGHVIVREPLPTDPLIETGDPYVWGLSGWVIDPQERAVRDEKKASRKQKKIARKEAIDRLKSDPRMADIVLALDL